MVEPRHLIVALAAMLLVAGCEAGGPVGGPAPPLPPAVSVTGTWRGEAVSDFGSVREITLVLQQYDYDVVGRGIMTDPAGDVYFVGDVKGYQTYPEVSLVLTAELYQPMTARGRLTDRDVMQLVLDGSGWNGTAVTLQRQGLVAAEVGELERLVSPVP